MPDISLSVQVSRTLLGLTSLEINDHLNYYVTPSFLGAQVTWDRTQVTSPFVDDAVTVNRTRGRIGETITVEVRGDTQADLATNLDALLKAMTQDHYTLSVSVGGQGYSYQCEAADYQMTWSGPRMVSKQTQVQFTVPRSPIPLSGPI